MLDYIKTAAVGVAALTLSSLAVSAAPTVDFTVDWANSSVTLTDRDAGTVCSIFSCGIEANVNPLIGDATYPIGTGTVQPIDFIEWSGSGIGGVEYEVEATLAFSAPAGATTTGGGDVGAILVGGLVSAGELTWNTGVPSLINFMGSTFEVDFEGGSGLFAGSDYTTSATITGINVVPLPAAGLLLLGGIAGLGFASRKRKAA